MPYDISGGSVGQVLTKIAPDNFHYAWQDPVGGPGGAAWGSVTGTLSDQTDLQTALDGKSATSHNHNLNDLTEKSYNSLSNKPTLGDAAAKNTGTIAGTVAAGDHTHAQLHDRQHSITSVSDHTFPGGTTFLRADGVFASPPGGSEAFPVGAVFIAVVSTNPATLLGYGTWSAFAAGRVLVGLDSGQTEFDTAEETGGAKTHQLTTAEIPAHTHTQMRLPTATGGVTGFTVDTSMSGTPATTGVVTASTGSDGAHNNLQPYIVVYMWKRTA